MNAWRSAARRLDEEISNVGARPHGNQFHPLEEGGKNNHAPVNSPPLADGNIRVALVQLAEDATAQAQVVMAQDNQKVVPRPHKQIATMASHLRDFTTMYPPTFNRSTVEEGPQ